MPFNANDNTQNNKDKNEEQQPNQAVSLAGSGGQGNASATGRVANFSTGQQAGQSGSGRFTNLQKYIGANQGSGERLGGKIGENFNSKTSQQTKDINNQNSQIAQNIGAGKEALKEGQGFQTQLGDIGKGLESFKSMEDRGGFDAANQQAINFAKAPNFNRFQTIQAGNAIDNKAANEAQANALQAGTNLNSYTQDQLNKINTEQGRYDLLKNTFGNKKNYSSGNARFDQLFLQNSPSNAVGNLQNQFNQGNNSANQLLGNINTQGQDLSKLLTDEGNLVTGLNTQARTNQDLFNTKLGSQGNIDYINNLRNDKYNEYLNQLKTGQIGQEVATDLGLTGVNTYVPGASGAVSALANSSAPKMHINGNVIQQAQPFTPRSLGTYNTDLANTAGSYLQQGRNASSMQDIATQNDYDAYKALQSISGQDTGKLAGASTLDKAVQAGKNSEGQTLAERIAQQDADYRGKYAGKDYQANAFATQSGPGGFFSGGTGGWSVTDPTKTDVSPTGVFSGANDYGQYYNNVVNQANENKAKGSGATAYARANLDQYINNGNSAIAQDSSKAYDRGGDKESNRAAQQQAREASSGNLQQHLNNIINQTGIKNQAQIIEDKNNEILKRAKRFGGLV